MRTSLLVAILVGACGGGDDGAAPTIANLTVNPQTVPIGTATTISGSMTFADMDGDLEQFAAAVTPPGGSAQEITPVPIQTTGSPTEGMVSWALLLLPPAAGSYALEVWVIDGQGNDSNRLASALTAQ